MDEACPVCIEDYRGKKVERVKCQYCPCHACRGCQKKYILQSFEEPHCMECKKPWSGDFMAANFPLSFRKGELRVWHSRMLVEREKPTLAAMQVYIGYKKEAERLMAELTKARKEKDEHAVKLEKVQELCSSQYHSRRGLKDGIDKIKEMLRDCTDEEERERLKTQIAEQKKLHKEVETVYFETKMKTIMMKQVDQQNFAKVRRLSDSHYVYWSLYRDEPVPDHLQWVLNGEGAPAAGEGAPAPRRQRAEFIMKCPDDDCRGFLSSAYKCGTCEKWTCSACLVVLGPEKECGHVCDAAVLETAKTIKAETKPCPKCGTRIMKTEGCDQMWCVMEGCNTAFSWQTGQVIAGRIHNPHYYEWLRRTGGGEAPREPGDIPCGGVPDWWQLNRALPAALPHSIIETVMEIHRNIVEITDHRLLNYPMQMPAGVHKELHIQYLTKEIGDDEWRRGLENTHARFVRKREIGQILQTIATLAADALRQIVGARGMTDAQYRDWLTGTAIPNLERLREYGNETLRALGGREKMAVPQLGDYWNWCPTRILWRKSVAGDAAAGASVKDDASTEA